jgi:UDP-glucuronate 4-epimerase
MAGRAIELYNFGRMQRDFTFVDDVVEGIVRLLPLPPECGKLQGTSAQAPMRLCNIGNQRPVELLHVIRTIERCLGRSADIRLMPMQPGDVYETQARVDKLAAVTGYWPRFTIEEGIQRFADWYLYEYLPMGLANTPIDYLPLPVQNTRSGVVATAREA